MNLHVEFFRMNPEYWNFNPDYEIGDVIYIKALNNHVEGDIALRKEYTGILTKNEFQSQLLVNVAEEHQKAYP